VCGATTRPVVLPKRGVPTRFLPVMLPGPRLIRRPVVDEPSGGLSSMGRWDRQAAALRFRGGCSPGACKWDFALPLASSPG
jgi:hypothetical protein